VDALPKLIAGLDGRDLKDAAQPPIMTTDTAREDRARR